ncbi:SDR family NAD(P)-dependent oxidoreductase [Mycolicibacterium litorale]|uniref:SDR family NAD(P)-dependent oxidoreductase n=1 Tax=Mycolicibacterium litorale TaxID=758802 RepID=UPI003CF52810
MDEPWRFRTVESGVRSGGLGVYDLRGRVAVVVGGSSGIGAATSRRLASAGARVVVGYRTGAERARDIVGCLDGNGHVATQIDATDAASLSRLAEMVSAGYGRVDVLVNSAGTTRRVAHGDLDALSDEDFDAIMVANVRAPFATIRALRPLLESSGDAVVVNVSSIAGFTGSGSSVAYCASKSALDSITRSLGRALGPKMRFVSVAPAAVDTDFVPGRSREAIQAQASSTPLKVLADPDDIALSILGAVTHLRLSTGAVIVTDGGKFLV